MTQNRAIAPTLPKRGMQFSVTPLAVLRELPTLEDKLDSPGLAMIPALRFQKKGTLENGSKTELPDSHEVIDVKETKETKEAKKSPARTLVPNRIEIPARIRKDEEFTISSPIKDKLRISVKKMSDGEEDEEAEPQVKLKPTGTRKRNGASESDVSTNLLLPKENEKNSDD